MCIPSSCSDARQYTLCRGITLHANLVFPTGYTLTTCTFQLGDQLPWQTALRQQVIRAEALESHALCRAIGHGGRYLQSHLQWL